MAEAAADFDGSASNISFTNVVTGSGAISIAVWANLDSVADNKPFVEVGNIHLGIYNDGSVIGPNFHVPGSFQIRANDTSTNISTGSYFFIVVTHAGGQVNTTNTALYVNATACVLGGNAGTQTIDSSGLIGKRTSGPTYADGRITHVMLWNDQLTSSEVTALYNSGTVLYPTANSGNYASAANLQHYFKCNEGSGTTIDDTQQVANGTFNNGSWLAGGGPPIPIVGVPKMMLMGIG